MRDANADLLAVSDRDRLRGTLSERDIIVKCIAEGWDPTKVKVREIMNEDFVTCFENEDLEEATRLMETNGINKVLVVNSDNRPVGVFSAAELALGWGDMRLAGEVVKCVSQAYQHRR
jgi:CBS domain-containing protein